MGLHSNSAQKCDLDDHPPWHGQPLAPVSEFATPLVEPQEIVVMQAAMTDMSTPAMDCGRAGVEAVLAEAVLVGLVATLAVKDWRDVVLRVDPGGGNGCLDWLSVAAFAVATAIFSIFARQAAP
jgi:hypothetical protein